MLYSSGTTGRPKGVKRAPSEDPVDTINPLMRMLCVAGCGMSEKTVYLSPAPLYHAAPLRFNMMVGSLGGTSVIMEHFDAENYLRMVETLQDHPVAAGADHVRAHAEAAGRCAQGLRPLDAEGRDPRRGALPDRREGRR